MRVLLFSNVNNVMGAERVRQRTVKAKLVKSEGGHADWLLSLLEQRKTSLADVGWILLETICTT